MKILYVSQYHPPEMGAPSARVSEVAGAWARAGHEVTVLTGVPNHPTGVVPPEYRGKSIVRERHDGYEVLRVWLYATPNRGFTRRVLSFVSFLSSSVLFGALCAERPDVLIATSPQLLVGAAGLALARIKRVPFVFEVRDLWPRSAVELGVLKDKSTIALLESLERGLYRAADRVVVVSEEFIGEITRAGVPPERIVYIPNGVDLEGALAYGAPPPSEARRRPGVFTASYVGTHGIAHGLTTFLDVAERFRGDPKIRFLFVGEGAEKNRIRAEAKARGLQSCTFLDAVSREVVAGIYEASDVCLVPLIDRPVFRTVLPSKIFEMMGAGRPIVLSVAGRAARVVREARAGLCVPPEDAAAIAGAIGWLRDNPGPRASMGENGRRYVRRYFDRRVLAARYAGALLDLLSEKNQPRSGPLSP